MVRRLTAQLMHYVTSPPTLTSDPARLLEEFPKWLEKVSTKLSGGIILVLDSADRIEVLFNLLTGFLIYLVC